MNVWSGIYDLGDILYGIHNDDENNIDYVDDNDDDDEKAIKEESDG